MLISICNTIQIGANCKFLGLNTRKMNFLYHILCRRKFSNEKSVLQMEHKHRRQHTLSVKQQQHTPKFIFIFPIKYVNTFEVSSQQSKTDERRDKELAHIRTRAHIQNHKQNLETHQLESCVRAGHSNKNHAIKFK